MPHRLVLSLILLSAAAAPAGACLAQATQAAPVAPAQDADARVREQWPRVWTELQWIERQGVRHAWVSGMRGPARALPARNLIELNPDFVGRAEFPQDRWLIVVWHEYGHIVFHRDPDGAEGERRFQRQVASEHAAFEFSLKRALDWARTRHDPGPLREVVKNLRERDRAAQGKPAGDPHAPAIRQLMGEPAWREAESLVAASGDRPSD